MNKAQTLGGVASRMPRHTANGKSKTKWDFWEDRSGIWQRQVEVPPQGQAQDARPRECQNALTYLEFTNQKH